MKKFTFLVFSLCFSFLSWSQNQHGPRAFLGVESNHVSKDKAKALNFENPYGAYITEVIENTAAEEAGLQTFDYLVGISENSFSDNRSFSHVIRTYKAGDDATLQVVRNGTQLSIPVTFGKQSEAIYRKIPREEEPFFGVKQDHYNWREKGPGVKVNIVDNSAAEALGLQDEDIITTINNNKIVDWHDLGTAIDNMKPGDPIKVDFLRAGKEMSGDAVIKSYAATYNNHHDNNQKKNVVLVSDEAEETEAEAEETAPEILKNLISNVDMEDVTQEEADDMKEKVGVDMPVINNLAIEKLNIFPNPNDGLFNLTFDLPNRGQTNIRIFNGSGSLIYQNDMQQFSGLFKDRIDISSRAKGIYFLEVNQDGKSITKKVILQ